MRLILLVTVTTLILLALRALISSGKKNRTHGRHTTTKKIVPCTLCRLHIPINDAIEKNSLYFCSHRHLEEWQRSNPDN